LETAGGNGNSLANTLYFISAWGNHKRERWMSDEPTCTKWEFEVDTTDSKAEKANANSKAVVGEHPLITSKPRTKKGSGLPWLLGVLLVTVVLGVAAYQVSGQGVHGEERAEIVPQGVGYGTEQ